MQIWEDLDEYKNDGYGTEQCCKSIQKLLSDNDGKMGKSTVQLVGMVGVIATAGISVLKELIQLFQSGAAYFKNYQNIVELGTCVLAIIFVVDFNDCHAETGLRHGWQWEIGAFTITVAWIIFLSNVQMFPFLGIYILMITNILKTFLKLSIVVILFVLAFALGFHCLLAEQVQFGSYALTMTHYHLQCLATLHATNEYFRTSLPMPDSPPSRRSS